MTEPTLIAGAVIPKNAVVSMCSAFVHLNAEIFLAPRMFNPDRWMKESSGEQGLHNYIVAFSKGPRACFGVNLAWAEMLQYLVLGNVFRKAELDLVNERTTYAAWRASLVLRYKGGLEVRVRTVRGAVTAR
ncbi:cytochrome P450 [Ephemerocybe angulata]|uniref:Cytochrome P450 n=1 Tax=Ephemerocybe angulata TaxID=980116 RepID=A0A8H6I4F1_9AGAR|nr:cytochrome P450 [Tulosesus angulatus]